MARHKKGNPIHGWLVLDKPIGMTSTQAVATIKHLYDAQKAGHAGTLDPLATGILPIALGEATKTCSFAVEGEKAYRFTVRWGIETNTDDAEGEVVRTSDKRPIPEEIEAILPDFTGEIEQVPPTFSAIKVNGERAYDLARDGELDPVQQGFMQCHGLQCGFCTPGMLMTARHLLDRDPDPSEATIREAISGQLCRCTGYQNIVAAVRWAAEHPHGAAEVDDEAVTQSAPAAPGEGRSETEVSA